MFSVPSRGRLLGQQPRAEPAAGGAEQLPGAGRDVGQTVRRAAAVLPAEDAQHLRSAQAAQRAVQLGVPAGQPHPAGGPLLPPRHHGESLWQPGPQVWPGEEDVALPGGETGGRLMLSIECWSCGQKQTTFMCIIAWEPHRPGVQCHDPILWMRRVREARELGQGQMTDRCLAWVTEPVCLAGTLCSLHEAAPPAVWAGRP